MRQAFDQGFYVGGALATAMTLTKGHSPNGRFSTEPNAAAPLTKTGRAKRYPEPDGRYLFDKLSSVFASGNRTRDDQPNHIQVAHRVRRPVAEAWTWMCPAHVYDIGTDHGDGTVTLVIALELRPVRRDQREGRSAHAARGRLGPRVHPDLSARLGEGGRRGPEGVSVRGGPLAIATRCSSVGCVPNGLPTRGGLGRRATSSRTPP